MTKEVLDTLKQVHQILKTNPNEDKTIQTSAFSHGEKSCPICEGTGWIKEVYDVSPVYGEQESRTVEVYHLCLCQWNEEE